MNDGIALARLSIARHSKSFSLASRLLPGEARDAARVIYAWCRRVDDAVDESPPHQRRAVLASLEEELGEVYGGAPRDPVAAAFQRVVHRVEIPAQYPEDLLLGMRMDVEGHIYATWDDLISYCHRVAGTVGLMICQVLGVRAAGALRHAAHLGIAMQLTNVCRDVLEDWDRGRLYLPDDSLAIVGCAGLYREVGRPFPRERADRIGLVVRALLERASRYYLSGDRGLCYLSRRAAWAVCTARLVYADIGRCLQRRNYDVLAGRVHVGSPRKLLLVGRAALATLIDRRSRRAPALATADGLLRFPDDVPPH